METRIGLYNENFKMSRPEIQKTEKTLIRDRESFFYLSAGPLIFQGNPLKETYVLEIDYSASEKVHRNRLGPLSFGSHLGTDYAEKANDLALKFCKDNSFILNNHINSWPKFQAIVSKANN